MFCEIENAPLLLEFGWSSCCFFVCEEVYEQRLTRIADEEKANLARANENLSRAGLVESFGLVCIAC